MQPTNRHETSISVCRRDSFLSPAMITASSHIDSRNSWGQLAQALMLRVHVMVQSPDFANEELATFKPLRAWNRGLVFERRRFRLPAPQPRSEELLARKSLPLPRPRGSSAIRGKHSQPGKMGVRTSVTTAFRTALIPTIAASMTATVFFGANHPS